MTIHMDMAARKTAPFPPDIRANIKALASAHSTVTQSKGINKQITIPSK